MPTSPTSFQRIREGKMNNQLSFHLLFSIMSRGLVMTDNTAWTINSYWVYGYFIVELISECSCARDWRCLSFYLFIFCSFSLFFSQPSSYFFSWNVNYIFYRLLKIINNYLFFNNYIKKRGAKSMRNYQFKEKILLSIRKFSQFVSSALFFLHCTFDLFFFLNGDLFFEKINEMFA